MELKDGLKFKLGNEEVIFNHYSFCETIKHIMMEYGQVTYDFATEKLMKSYLVDIPETYDDITFLSHELEFHWAMLTLHGEMYWTKGIPSDFNKFKKEYLSWEDKTRRKYNLKESFDYYELAGNKNN